MSAPDELIAGRYRLVHRVGTGGMGVVWEAWDERLHRRVAVKQLHAQPGLSDTEAELVSLRAMREARITARLDHPHAVPVFDVVEHEGQPCLIMQYLPSTPLSGLLRERKVLSVEETARIGAQTASALAAAHRAGIVHRDVKPGNVLIAGDGTARLSDFGISHALGDATLTATGMVHGTPAYLAPEVARGADSTFASDVFGLGATLYTAREGAPPFGKDQNSIALLHRVASGSFTAPSQSGILTPLLMRMLAADPADRPPMDEVARTLTRLAAESGAELDTLKFAEADIATVASSVPPRERPWTRPALPAQVPPATETMASAADMESAPPVSSPPATTPPASESRPLAAAPGRPRRRRGLVAAILAVTALLGVALAVYALLPVLDPVRTTGPDPGSPASGAPAPVATPTSSTRTSPSASTPAPSPSAPTSAQSSPVVSLSPSQTSASEPATPKSSEPATPKSSEPATPKSSKSAPKSSEPAPKKGAGTAGQLAAAITSYYALMPDNTDAGWSRLTSSYQRNRVGGRGSYEGFWGDIDRVSVSRVRGNPPDRAEATVRYVFKSGRVVRERTSYGLKAGSDGFKINSSKVLSSITQ